MVVTSTSNVGARPTSPRSRPPLVSARGMLSAALVLAGALHLTVSTGRAADWRAEGLALALAGVAQVLLGITIVASAHTALLRATTALSSACAIAWLVTRADGYPFGSLAGIAPDPGAFEIILVAAELGAAALAAAGLLTHGRLLGAAGARFEVLAPLALAVAAVPGLATSSWAHDAAHGPLSSHTHGAGGMPRSTLTPAERAVLGDELVAVRELALSLPTLADARAAGWAPSGRAAPFAGLLVTPPEPVTPGEPFDLRRPLGLLYAAESAEAPVVGVEYAVWSAAGREPEGFTGGDDVWHLHTGSCRLGGRSSPVVWVPLDEAITGPRCGAVDGELELRAVWMLRVWVVPGWENPAGTFAHDHPALG